MHLGNNMYKLKCFFLLRFTFVSSVIIKQKKSKAKKKQGRKFLKNNLKKTFNLRTRWQKRVSSIEIIAYTNNLNTEKFKTLGLICRKLDATHFSKVKYGRGVLIQAPFPYERGGGGGLVETNILSVEIKRGLLRIAACRVGQSIFRSN